MSTLEVVCWKWAPKPGYRSRFEPSAVNTLRRMVERNLKIPHRFSCITDDPAGIDPEVRIIPIWDTYADIPNPSGNHNPSCYRRLKMFSPEAKELLGEKIVSLDLDVVVTGDLTPLFDRDEEFIIWGGQSVNPRGSRVFCWYNGSVMMLKAGTRPRVWSEFDPKRSPMEAHRANSRGSDQGWISYCLGNGEKTWGYSDGVYSYRNHVAAMRGNIPDNCRLVVFHGKVDPWTPQAQAMSPWIKEFYR